MKNKKTNARTSVTHLLSKRAMSVVCGEIISDNYMAGPQRTAQVIPDWLDYY